MYNQSTHSRGEMWGERLERKTNMFEEILIKNFPNLIETINSEIQETQQASKQNKCENTLLRNITIKLLKIG